MERFKMPSKAVFQSRKLFHMCQRELAESIDKWLLRISSSIGTCEYETICDVMLIDKFLSGLNNEEFEKFAQNTEWSEKLLFEAVIENVSLIQNSYECDDLNSIEDLIPLQDTPMKDDVTNVWAYFLRYFLHAFGIKKSLDFKVFFDDHVVSVADSLLEYNSGDEFDPKFSSFDNDDTSVEEFRGELWNSSQNTEDISNQNGSQDLLPSVNDMKTLINKVEEKPEPKPKRKKIRKDEQ